MKTKYNLPKKIFYALVGIFVILIGYILVPMDVKRTIFPFIGVLALVFFILGIALVITSLKLKGKLKKYFILTGASAAGILISIILHNVVYGLFIQLFGQNFWGSGGDEPIFFILAIIVLPIAFLIGVIGSIIHIKKSSKKR